MLAVAVSCVHLENHNCLLFIFSAPKNKLNKKKKSADVSKRPPPEIAESKFPEYLEFEEKDYPSDAGKKKPNKKGVEIFFFGWGTVSLNLKRHQNAAQPTFFMHIVQCLKSPIPKF